MCAFKIRIQGTLDSTCQFLILLFPILSSLVLFAQKGNQETTGVDFVFQKLGTKPLQRKPRNENTEGFEPTALSIPAHVLIHSGMASFRLPKRHDIDPMFSPACNQPLPENPPKIRNRAPQFLKFKKSSPSNSYFGVFPICQSLI